jgi:hypothetical protein
VAEYVVAPSLRPAVAGKTPAVRYTWNSFATVKRPLVAEHELVAVADIVGIVEVARSDGSGAEVHVVLRIEVHLDVVNRRI